MIRMRWNARLGNTSKAQSMANRRLLRDLDRWLDLPWNDIGSKKYHLTREQYHRSCRSGREVYRRALRRVGETQLPNPMKEKVGRRRAFI